MTGLWLGLGLENIQCLSNEFFSGILVEYLTACYQVINLMPVNAKVRAINANPVIGGGSRAMKYLATMPLDACTMLKAHRYALVLLASNFTDKFRHDKIPSLRIIFMLA